MRHTPMIFVIDDDDSIRWVLEKFLERNHYHYQAFAEGKLALKELKQVQPDLLICDIRLPDIDGLNLLQHVKSQYPQLPVIMMTGHSDLQNAVNAFQQGAFEYLPKPFDLEELGSTITRALEEQLSNQVQSAPELTGIIGTAPAMQEVFRVIGRLSQSHANVLITGASGTGKELVAQSLHTHSLRKDKAFIALNMAAIPAELIESELFGHEKGAFTGANSAHQGRFEQADGGTLFLDEIGDMPLEMQTRLLRVLATKEFYRVGGKVPIRADVRILAATHQNLPELVQQGRFREDLYHRLNVVRIQLPDLRERLQDVPQLAEHFLLQAAHELNTSVKTLLPETMSILQNFDWPGNVRQLENTCRWLTVMAVGQTILPQDLPDDIRPVAQVRQDQWQSLLKQQVQHQLSQDSSDIAAEYQMMLEQTLLECALEFTQGHKQQAAKLLGWGRNTVTRKLNELTKK